MGKLAAPVRADKEMMFTNRQLVALMWPLLLEQLLAITVGLADSLMVATVGDAAISAVSLVDSISNLMIYIFSAMATGGAAVAGQYIGQRQKEDACNAGQQLIALLGAVSIFFVALLYLFRTQILTVMFGHIEPDVMAATNTYYLYVMASIRAAMSSPPFSASVTPFTSWRRGRRSSSTPKPVPSLPNLPRQTVSTMKKSARSFWNGPAKPSSFWIVSQSRPMASVF